MLSDVPLARRWHTTARQTGFVPVLPTAGSGDTLRRSSQALYRKIMGDDQLQSALFPVFIHIQLIDGMDSLQHRRFFSRINRPEYNRFKFPLPVERL